MKIVAVDQGTTSTRALVVEGGAARMALSVKHRQYYPYPGWVEHDPAEILAGIRACLQAAGPADAIGIDNQGESCLAWDANTRQALSRIIVWQDNRTAAMIEAMKARGLESISLERSGLPLDPYFSASKLAWLLENEPAVKQAWREQRLRLGTTDAFFLDNLVRAFVTDATTASRTGLMNIETEQWDVELCRLFGVPTEALPKILPTMSVFGTLDGVPITASVVDQQASLFGHGCREIGDVKATFGTGVFALAITGDDLVRAPQKGLLPTIAWSGAGGLTRALDGGVYDAGSAVEWARRIGLFENFADLDAFDKAPAIERRIVFVPALSGLASPHWDRSAGALWLGMSANTSRQDLCQSLLEGIALRTDEVLRAFSEYTVSSRRLSIDGGLVANNYFCQFLADVTEREIVTHSNNEITAMGTAGLAAATLGAKLDIPVEISRGFLPRDADRGTWRTRFADAVRRTSQWR